MDLEDYKPRRNNYQPLREGPSKQSEVETNQKTEAAPEANRPETVRQPGYTQSQSMGEVQPSANIYDKAAQLHMQKQWEARQQPVEKQTEKEARIETLAKEYSEKPKAAGAQPDRRDKERGDE